MELDAVEPIKASLEPGETYRVIVNDSTTSSFSRPKSSLRDTFVAQSPIQSAEVAILESFLPQYQLLVVSGLPKGSGCSQFNGYEIRRRESNEIEVVVTHHEVADQLVVCTADFPIVETNVPLGPGFEPGEEYTVRVNSDTVTSFVAHQARRGQVFPERDSAILPSVHAHPDVHDPVQLGLADPPGIAQTGAAQ